MAEKPLCVPEVQITGPTRTVSRCQSAVRDPSDGTGRRIQEDKGWKLKVIDAKHSVSK